MYRPLFIFLILIVNKCNCGSKDRYCLSNDNNPYLLFGTKTSYDVLRSNCGSATDCEAIQMWILSRHGARHAEEKDLKTMKKSKKLLQLIMENHETGSGEVSLCDKDLEALFKWTWDENVEKKPGELNDQGWKEMKELATRYKRRYPGLMGIKYTPEQFYFRHTDFQRTNDSCRAFVDGLFGDGAHKSVQIDPVRKEDIEIQTYEICPAWHEEVDDIDDLEDQKKLYYNSKQFKTFLKNISDRLGFGYQLDTADITSMYDNCRFDKTRRPAELSPWCSVFTKYELVLMEYNCDINRYYRCSYGHEFNPKLGCFPLKLMMDTFEKTVAAGVAKQKTLAYFTHDTMMDMTLSAMGYAKDQEPLRGKSFDDFFVNRLYRTSLNIGFGCNLAAILHDCKTGADRYKVQFFLSERPMQLKGCPDGLCTWNHLKEYLSFTKKCSLDFCSIDETATTHD